MYTFPNSKVFFLMKKEGLNGLILWKKPIRSQTGVKTKDHLSKYDLPWPIQDRDYVMTQKNFSIDTKTITTTYQSVENPKNRTRMLYRAYAQRTYWKMEALPNGQTSICRKCKPIQRSTALMVDQHDSKGLALQLHHQSHQTSTT